MGLVVWEAVALRDTRPLFIYVDLMMGSFSLRYRLMGPILNRNPVNVKQMNRTAKSCPTSHRLLPFFNIFR